MNEPSSGRSRSGSSPDAGAPRPDSDRGSASLREALRSNRAISAWSLERRVTRSSQLFLAREKVEAERSAFSEELAATVYVLREEGLGSAQIRILPGEEGAVGERVEAAVAMSREAVVEPFPLARPENLPDVSTIDGSIAREPARELERLRTELLERVHAERGVALASSEIFLDHDEVYFENSEGVVADRSGTRAAAEIVLIGFGDGATEAENQGLRFRRRGVDLDFAHWLPELARQARDAARATTFPGWSGSVILPGEYLSQYLGPVENQASAETAHLGFGTWELGQVVGGDRILGDPVTISTDATLPYGTSSARCDGDGVPAQRATIVENGVFRRHWADQRYGHYRKVPVTGQFANWIVDPGTGSSASLRDGDFLEVVRFSWLNPSPGTGDFAAEIRFGYLHRGGTTIPFRGGSVAGNVFTSLTNCRLSRETVFIGDGLVPVWVRFEGLATVGG